MLDVTASLPPQRPPLRPSPELVARLAGELGPLRQLPPDDRLDALLLDQRRRWQLAQLPSVEAYRQACPDLVGDDETLLLMLTAEAMLRRQSGEAVEVGEYVRRFPGQADELSRQFQVESALETAPPDGNTQGGTITLDGPAVDLWRAAPSAGSAAAGVPGYEILGELGQGGMGVVYKARQLGLNRTVALKMILAGAAAGTSARERFVREGQSVAKLKHPHIVQVFDFGEHAGQLYFALEYVGGGSLARQLGKPWPARKAAELVAVLAGAVQHAHERDIIHRDLKPANILLDEQGRPHVTDFGLARQIESGRLTADGAILGTPAYMAPEQAVGRPESMGPATDVFGLGAILYQLLTGRPPYQGPDVLTTLRQAEQGKVLPVREANPQVPAALARICDRALSGDPARRHPSAALLERDLRRYLDWGRRLKAWGAAGAAALMLLIGGVFLLDNVAPERERSSHPPHDAEHKGKEPPVAPALTGSLIVRIGTADRRKDFIPVDQPGALPARTGEWVRIEVELNRPAYLYLFWLDAKEVAVLYPWDHEEQTLNDPPPPQKPRMRLSSPENPPGATKIRAHRIEGESGLETALLLARSTPLPPEVDLKKLIKPLPQPAYQSEQECAIRGFDAGRPMAAELHQNRGLAKKAEEVDEPLLAMLDALKEHFEVIRAVRFAHKK